MFQLDTPLFLLTFILFIPLIYFYLKKSRGLTVSFPTFSAINPFLKSKNIVKRHFPFFLRLIVLSLIIFSLARPQIVHKYRNILSSGVDIMLVLDTSKSMEAQDFAISGYPVDRLTIVKNVVNEFIRKRVADRIGIVVFGKFAYTQSPVTLDHKMLTNLVDNMFIGMAGNSTSIGSALGIAVKRLKAIESKSKIIILLTDGRNTSGEISPETAARLAKTYNIKIYTIGVGSNDPSRLALTQALTGYDFSQVALDEDALTEIAESTGGRYFRAEDTEALREIYETINKMEKTKAIVREYSNVNELYPYFLAFALAVFLLEIALFNTILSKLP